MLGDLECSTVGTIIAVAADVALIVDGDGIVRDLALGRDEIPDEIYSDWVGRHWVEIVTPESRSKVEALRREASQTTVTSRRQLNHRSQEGREIPVLYAAVEIRPDGRMVAVGRDLSDMAMLQQRLVQAQQALERDYTRLRQTEMRYRLLFRMTSEAVLIVDAATLRITEASPAAQRLRTDDKPLVGMELAQLFSPASALAVDALVATVRTIGHADDVRARLADDGREFRVSATLFRQDLASYVLLRLAPVDAEAVGAARERSEPKLCPYADVSADGLAVTDSLGRMIAANRAFFEMAELSGERQAIGQSLERWLGRSGVDLRVLLTSLREKGAIRLFATSVQGEQGGTTAVEVSASTLVEKGETRFVFSIRNVNRRLGRPLGGGREVPRSVEQMSQLIGIVPLKEIVRESTDIIERLCIEAALDLTSDNRAAAAELLGLSRQSLYVKLRRFGIDDAAV
jgi:transcriptional regulator PpsR